MINTFGKIDRCLFNGELVEALDWATEEVKSLLMEMNLNRNERWAKLTKAINERYPKLGHDGGVFLASAAMLSARLGGQIMSTQLYAPKSYWEVPLKERNTKYNGAGPAGYGWLVPDTLWGLSVTAAANIHDHMYGEGKTLADKEEADRVFLNNMIRIIEADAKSSLKDPFLSGDDTRSWVIKTLSKITRRLRLRRAKTYYWAVSNFGGPAFWANKNQVVNMGIAQ